MATGTDAAESRVYITLRPESADDEEFVRRLILENVAAELGATAWPEPMRTHQLGIQYTSRRQSHRDNYPGAGNRIAESGGQRAGWVVTAILPDEVRLVDIIVPQALRGRGIGAAVIGAILTEAATLNKPVRLHVNTANAGAIRLYERFGFKRIDGDELRHFMEARPAQE